MSDKTAIIIINLKESQDTLDCLDSLSKIENPSFETILVNNQAPSKFIKSIQNEYPKVHLINNQANLGFCRANNQGAKLAQKLGCKFICLLNNDTLIKSDFLQQLKQTFIKHRAGAVVPKIYFASGYEFHQDRYSQSDQGKVIWYAGGQLNPKTISGQHFGVDQVDKGQFDQLKEIELATGCCFFTSLKIWQQFNGFDERFFVYYEDLDLSFRLKKANFKIIYQPQAVIWHKNAGSSGSGSPTHDYYLTRNQLLFARKHLSFSKQLPLYKQALKFLIAGRSGQRRGVLDFIFQRYDFNRHYSY
ncbi:glycosyltransferase family 2 protein [Candidatus Microgenomates bacterium]|nr:glycosyltransferase family 2 protein [Candidatus Microgenomates bacterium]